MNRQVIRKAFLLISFLLFPITQFYFSPYLIIDGASKGIVNGSFIVFIFFIVGGTFVGRAFCGWIMPCGGLQEICFIVNNKKAKGGKLNLIKYFIWIPWLLVIIGMIVQFGGYRTIDPFFHIENGISVGQPWTYFIYYGVIILIVTFSLVFGKRAGCHYICWMAPFMLVGRKIRNFLKTPALQLISNKRKCISCNQCNKSCPMSLDVSSMVDRENMENSECILCGACVDVCKTNAIKYSFGTMQNKRSKPDDVNTF